MPGRNGGRFSNVVSLPVLGNSSRSISGGWEGLQTDRSISSGEIWSGDEHTAPKGKRIYYSSPTNSTDDGELEMNYLDSHNSKYRNLPLKQKFKPFRGIKDELIGRFGKGGRYWKDDWSIHTLNEWLTMVKTFIIVLLSSILVHMAFGQFLVSNTEENIGFLEVIVSAAIGGLFQTLIGGQPLIIYGATGPVAVLYSLLFRTSQSYNLPFFGWLGWANIWAAIFLVILSCLNVSDLTLFFTRFSGEILEMIVALDMMTTGVRGVVNEFEVPQDIQVSDEYPWILVCGMMAIIFSTSMFILSRFLGKATNWSTLWANARTTICQFGPTIIMVVITLMSYIPEWAGNMPEGIPHRIDQPFAEWGIPRSNIAHWTNWINMGRCSAATAFSAMVPGMCIAALLFVDHNMSTRLAVEAHGLKYPLTRNWDLLVLAIHTFVCGLLGLPPSSAGVPNPAHTRALSSIDSDGNLKVLEQRYTNLFHSLLLGSCIFIMPLFSWLPTSVLWGYLMVLATESFDSGNQLYLRCKLLLSSSRTRSRSTAGFLDVTPIRSIIIYSAIQMIMIGIDFGLNVARIPAATVFFPLLIIMSAFPIRSHMMHLLLPKTDLAALDTPYTIERKAPGPGPKETVADHFTKAHKGGVGVRRKLSDVEIQGLIRRRATEMDARRNGMPWLLSPRAVHPHPTSAPTRSTSLEMNTEKTSDDV